MDNCRDRGCVWVGVLESVWAPDSFIVVDEIVGILVVLVNKIDGDFISGVREGTEVSILARVSVSTKGLAKLAFISTRVIELFDLVVGLGAVAVGLIAQDV